jgi:hypothetical protein
MTLAGSRTSPMMNFTRSSSSAVRISCCLSSSRLRMRISSVPASSRRRTIVAPNDPVPPVTRTTSGLAGGSDFVTLRPTQE